MLTRTLRRGLAVVLCLFLAVPGALLSAAEPNPELTLQGQHPTALASAEVNPRPEITNLPSRGLTEPGRTTSAVFKVWGTTAIGGNGRVPANSTSPLACDSLTRSEELPPALTRRSPTLSEAAPEVGGNLVVTLQPRNFATSSKFVDSAVLSAEELLTIRPALQMAQQSAPIGTGAHGKMTSGEKLRTFRIGRLSHGASVAVMGALVVGTIATAVVVPLTVGD